MALRQVFLLVCFAALLGRSAIAADAPIHHELSVRLDPAKNTIHAVDRVRGALGAEARFLLHADLKPSVVGDGLVLEPLDEPDLKHHGINGSFGVPLTEYRVRGDGTTPVGEFELHYSGTIHHPVVSGGEEYARSFSGSPGLIDPAGVVLSAGTAWFPMVRTSDEGPGLVTFDLRVLLPKGWSSVSQGRREERTTIGDLGYDRWVSPEPMDDIYLIAAQFTVTRRNVGSVEAVTYLRRPDPNLAAKYLEATAQYLDMYQRLIGPYPYTKFALVENFWETGYGMPSFTLLGSRVIRFPFILHSSYPHEILHNWWGNSVFVDYERGNWCEGLTAYLADHLVKEGQGRGAEYRRDSLDRYANYVREGKDFPLAEFRSRHSSATEAVGYGKCLMLFHMLRRQVGDAEFSRGLARFYRQFRFQRASFDDIAVVFSELTGDDYGPFFRQWVDRTGAPELELEVGDERVVLRQIQKDAKYTVRVPVAVTYAGDAEATMVDVDLNRREAKVPVDMARVTSVVVDPQYDVFRRLDRSETPPTFGRLFGAKAVTIVVPASESQFDVASWRVVSQAWASDTVRVVSDADLDALPDSGSVWVLGRENRFASEVAKTLAQYGANFAPSSPTGGLLDFGVTKVPYADHCFAVALPRPTDRENAIGWLGATRADSLAGLARKLPHYGKYSFLAFSGADPTNDAKGQWPAVGSPLVWHRDGAEAAGTLAKREPLGRLAPVFDPGRLRAHVDYLASDELEGRGVGTRGIEAAAEYIAAQFEEMGLQPGAADGSYFERFEVAGGPDGKPASLRNVIGVLPGSDASWREQSVVLGAHYDHLGYGWPDVRAGEKGKIHNGADDNASGVSVMLEVAGLLSKTHRPRRSIVFVAFSGEEWGRKGSQHFASTERSPFVNAKTLGMVNLDGLGRLNDRKLAVLGAGTAYEWPHIAMGIGFTTGVESNPINDDLDASDHRSFHDIGVPAIHLFGGAHEDYHRSTDDADKIDLGGLLKASIWVREAMVYLTEREEPLRAQLDRTTAPSQPEVPEPTEPTKPGSATGSDRRVSLGTMPDYQFPGPGVRVERALPNTPASKAGIKAGDVLVEINGNAIKDLRGYSQELAKYAPGDRIRLTVERNGALVKLEATLRAR